MDKRYFLSGKQEGYWTFVVTKTDCVNEKGHYFEWIFKDHTEHEAILKQHPKFKGIGICRCVHCGKVKCSH